MDFIDFILLKLVILDLESLNITSVFLYINYSFARRKEKPKAENCNGNDRIKDIMLEINPIILKLKLMLFLEY